MLIDAVESSLLYNQMDRRTELLNSAENAARRRGYEGFSYADLAKDVGIRKASIHYHFPAKSDLALALLERYSENNQNNLALINKRHETASARLRTYTEVYRKALSGGNKLCLCVAFAISRDTLTKDVLNELDNFHAKSLLWLTENFERATIDKSITSVTNPGAEAAALLALVEGAQLIARSARRVADFEAATECFVSRCS